MDQYLMLYLNYIKTDLNISLRNKLIQTTEMRIFKKLGIDDTKNQFEHHSRNTDTAVPEEYENFKGPIEIHSQNKNKRS